MADLKKIKARIEEIAQSRGNVVIEDIEWVVKNLHSMGYEGKDREPNGHQQIFEVGERLFGVCIHHRGSRQLKRCYVNEFIKAMTELGLYDEN